MDFDANNCFLGLYIPESPYTLNVCFDYATFGCDKAVDLLKAYYLKYQTTSEKTAAELEKLRFSKRIFIYHLTPIFEFNKSGLQAAFKDINVQFRGIDYLNTRRKSQ